MAQGVVGFLQALDFGLQSDIFVTDPEILGQKEVMVKHMVSPLQVVGCEVPAVSHFVVAAVAIEDFTEFFF